MHLSLALASRSPIDGTLRQWADLARAESLLRHAAQRRDDPISLVALARCLEESHPGEDAPLEAALLIGLATGMVRRLVAAEEGSARIKDRFASVRAMSELELLREMLRHQKWYWPRDPRLRFSLQYAVEFRL